MKSDRKGSESSRGDECESEPPGSDFATQVLKRLSRIFKLNIRYGSCQSRSTEFTCSKEMSALLEFLRKKGGYSREVKKLLDWYEDESARYGEDGLPSHLDEIEHLKGRILVEIGIRN